MDAILKAEGMAELLQKTLSKVDKAGIEHFLKTGTLNGTFLNELEQMCKSFPVFKDSKGNVVREGDTIVITKHYTFQHMENKPAKIIWDAERGRYQFSYDEFRRTKSFNTTDDFCGVHSFERVGGF